MLKSCTLASVPLLRIDFLLLLRIMSWAGFLPILRAEMRIGNNRKSL